MKKFKDLKIRIKLLLMSLSLLLVSLVGLSMMIRHYFKTILNNPIFDRIADEELMQLFKAMDSYLIVMCSVFLFMGCIITLITSNYITKPLKITNHLLDAMSSCDFTDTQDIEKHDDEIGQINNSALIVKTTISEIIKKIKNSSLGIITSVDESESNLHLTNESLTEVTRSCEEISIGIQSLADTNQDSVNELTKLNDAINDAVSYINGLTDKINTSQQKSHTGSEIIKSLINANIEVNDFLKEMSTLIKDVQNESKSIRTVIEAIDEIARQTSLLSLNALIEAANMSSSKNNGFSVIANEIRSLSESTKDENKSIEIKLNIIGKKVDILTKQSEHFIQLMAGENDSIKETQNVINNLSSSITEMNEISDTLKDKITSVHLIKQRVLSMIENNANLAEEFSANIEEITGSIEDTLNNSNDNLQSVKKLKIISGALDNIVKTFKI